MRLLGICGSLRAESFNRGLLIAAQDVAPEGVTVDIYDIEDIPFYNADIDRAGQPESVLKLKQAIAESDGLLFASPEYNHSVPAVLKNAIDWVSRPLRDTPLMDKPAGIMGASGGPSGTIRAQSHLALILAACGSRVMPKPNIVVRGAPERFHHGRLTDQDTCERIERYLHALTDWTRLLNG